MISEILEQRVLLSSYDAVKDFSTTVNPNGAWTYGVRYTEFADFAPFPVATPLDFSPSATGWSENSGSPPYVGINTTKAEFTANGVDLPTNVLAMHPGGYGEYADVRFTVPAAGDLNVKFEFGGIDTDNTTTDVHVLYNNASLFDGAISSFGDSADVEPSLTIPNAVAGGIVDFVVGYGSNGTNYNDATSLTATITTGIANDHLVFTQQPKSGVVDEPVATQVKVVDSHGRLDKSVPDGVSLFLNTPAGSTATITNAAFLYVPFVDGVATFSGLQAPFIDTGGTYTLTAAADNGQYEPGGTSGVDSAVSKSFDISGLHIAFTKQPANCGVNSPVPFSFEVETDKNEPATGIDYGTFEVFFPANGNENDALEFTLTSAKFNNLQPPTGSVSPFTLTDPGSYTAIVACLNPELDMAFNDTDPNVVTSKAFTVFADRLAFAHQPTPAAVGVPLSMAVNLRDHRNHAVALSQFDDDRLFFTLNQVSGTGNFTVTNTGFVTSGTIATTYFYKGKFNNRAFDNVNPLSITAPGTYSLTVAVLDSNNIQIPDYEPVTSKTFTIKN